MIDRYIVWFRMRGVRVVMIDGDDVCGQVCMRFNANQVLPGYLSWSNESMSLAADKNIDIYGGCSQHKHAAGIGLKRE